MTFSPEQIKDHIRNTRLAPGNRMPLRYRWLWQLMISDCSRAEKLTGVSIWLYSSEDGKDAHPSTRTLRALTGLDASNIWRAKQKLKTQRFLTIEPGIGRKNSEYVLDVPPRTLSELDAGLRDCASAHSEIAPAHTLRDCASAHSEIAPAHRQQQRTSPTQPAPTHSPIKSESWSEAFLQKPHGFAAQPSMDAAQRFALEMKKLDDNKILGAPLFCDQAYGHLAELISRFGLARMESAVRQTIGRDRSGNPMRKGHVRTWGYFEREAATEYVDTERRSP